jgi:hypothetical protein
MIFAVWVMDYLFMVIGVKRVLWCWEDITREGVDNGSYSFYRELVWG